jgi:GNAT superfamily N-acetyltransferase
MEFAGGKDMSGKLAVRKVESASDWRAFFEFPWQVYKNDPNWVPPLLSMRRDLLAKDKNPDWKSMEGDYYAAWRDDEIVGTIAAYVNPGHNEANDERIGWFGAFDVYDDQEAATGLLETAADWVRSKGCDAICGPQTFTNHGDYGLLVDGFTRPILLMPYNPSCYQRLVECAGFKKREDLYSFHISRDQANQIGLLERLQRITQSVTRRSKITIRPMDRKHLREEFVLMKDIYNEAWRDTRGFVPMTPAELEDLVRSLGRLLDPDFVFFAYVAGEPVGFVMAVPDFNQVLKKAAPYPGVPETFTLLRALWYWKIQRVIDWVRLAFLGVKPAYREKGVDVALCATVLEACLRNPRIEHADSSWLAEGNYKMVNVARSLGLEIYKTHRVYEKRFADSGR